MFTVHKSALRLLVALLLLVSLSVLAACTATDPEPGAANTHEGEHEEGEHEHEEGEGHSERVPANGAEIMITSPEDGTTFADGEDVVVEIAVENTVLGEDGMHWHVYVDGESWGMVMGGNTSQVLRGLDPGEHEVEVVLSNAEHLDLEGGDIIHIMVE